MSLYSVQVFKTELLLFWKQVHENKFTNSSTLRKHVRLLVQLISIAKFWDKNTTNSVHDSKTEKKQDTKLSTN
jgi:hypothetical protein